jgi:hypothetical protein
MKAIYPGIPGGPSISMPYPAAVAIKRDMSGGSTGAGGMACARRLSQALMNRSKAAVYAIITFRGNCELSSRNVFLVSSSSEVGWTLPLTSVTRDTTVCSPGVAPVQT